MNIPLTRLTSQLVITAILTVFFAFSAAPLHRVLAQDASESDKISVPFDANSGTKFAVKILKERIDTKDEKTVSHYKTTTSYDGVIDEIIDERMIITWRPTGFNVEPIVTAAIKPKVDLESIAKEFNFPIQFESDLLGQPLKISNRDEFQEKMLKITQNMGGQAAAGVAKIMTDTFFKLPDEQFAKFFLQDAQLLGQGQAIELPKTGFVESSDEVPSPLGGPPVTYISKIRFVEETANEVVFELIGEMDPKSALENVSALAEKIAKQTGKPIEEVRSKMGQMKIERKDKVTFHISKSNGWTNHVEVKKMIVSESEGNSKGRTDIWDISVEMK
jgi:hypothetical protein